MLRIHASDSKRQTNPAPKSKNLTHFMPLPFSFFSLERYILAYPMRIAKAAIIPPFTNIQFGGVPQSGERKNPTLHHSVSSSKGHSGPIATDSMRYTTMITVNIVRRIILYIFFFLATHFFSPFAKSISWQKCNIF